MYHPSIVSERIGFAEEKIGWRLERHSPADIDQFNADLERKYFDEYNKAKKAAQAVDDQRRTKTLQFTLQRLLCNPEDPKLNADEVRFMQNERYLVMCSAAYFLEQYYWILNTSNTKQRFSWKGHSGQRVLFNCIAHLEHMRVAIEILLAKARQLGMTTLVEGLMLCKVLFSQSGVNAVIASANVDKTREMVNKVLLAYDKLPWWLSPTWTARQRSDAGFINFGEQSASISFQHGEQNTPISMGTTVIAYHLSEVSNYADACEHLIELGLWKAVHPSRRVFGILESTCKGDVGWWHDEYWNCKENWEAGGSRCMALFLPFYCCDDQYPNETEMRAHPIPEGWEPIPETRKMVNESMAYVESSPVLLRVLMQDGKPWEMRREQAHFWEWNFLSARRKGTEKSWYQEMPHTDEAAFQGSYENVFGKELIAELDTRRESDYDVYGIVGQSIEDRHEPEEDEIDYGTPEMPTYKVPVRWTSKRNQIYNWTLLPLEWEEPFRELSKMREADRDEHFGKLFVYLHPEPGYDYSIGVRASSGLGSDASAIAVCRRARNWQDHDVQAAEWRDNSVSHVEVFAWAMAIAAYYAKYMTKEHHCPTNYRMPYMAIEQVEQVGDTCQLQMRKMGYTRMHRMIRYDSNPAYNRKAKSHKDGWYTFNWSRPMLTDGFVVTVQNGWYELNSAYTLWEMQHWEVHYKGESGKVVYEAGEETTADGLKANALAAFCPNDIRSLTERTTKRFMEGGEERRPALDIEPRTSVGTKVPLSPPPERRPDRFGLTLTGRQL